MGDIKAGSRIVYRPVNYITNERDTGHRWYGARGTVIAAETLDRFLVAFDDFPQCNRRKWKNRFLANREDLEELEVKENVK